MTESVAYSVGYLSLKELKLRGIAPVPFNASSDANGALEGIPTYQRTPNFFNPPEFYLSDVNPSGNNEGLGDNWGMFVTPQDTFMGMTDPNYARADSCISSASNMPVPVKQLSQLQALFTEAGLGCACVAEVLLGGENSPASGWATGRAQLFSRRFNVPKEGATLGIEAFFEFFQGNLATLAWYIQINYRIQSGDGVFLIATEPMIDSERQVAKEIFLPYSIDGEKAGYSINIILSCQAQAKLALPAV